MREGHYETALCSLLVICTQKLLDTKESQGIKDMA